MTQEQRQQEQCPGNGRMSTSATGALEDTPLLGQQRPNDVIVCVPTPSLPCSIPATLHLKLTKILLLSSAIILLLFATARMMEANDGGNALLASILSSSAASRPSDENVVTNKIKVPVVASRLDPDLSCTVLECVDMIYTNGADPTVDRPSHLRAASSMQWITESRLAIVQDDSNFIALVDIDYNDDTTTETSSSLRIQNAYSISLPASQGGDRQFQKSRGNKEFKLDLEASIYVPKEYSPLNDSGFFLGFGSGSSPYRNVIILVMDPLLHANHDVHVDFQPVNTTYWSDYCGNQDLLLWNQVNDNSSKHPQLLAFYAPSLYDSWRAHTEFAGSELNIEGAAWIAPTTHEPAKIRFFQRGNGAGKGAFAPKSSTGEIIADEVRGFVFGCV